MYTSLAFKLQFSRGANRYIYSGELNIVVITVLVYVSQDKVIILTELCAIAVLIHIGNNYNLNFTSLMSLPYLLEVMYLHLLCGRRAVTVANGLTAVMRGICKKNLFLIY